MVECRLASEDAELPSIWNKQCEVKRFGMVPYAEGEKDVIEAWEGRLTFWTDGSFGDKTQRAGFGVLKYLRYYIVDSLKNAKI